MAIRTDDVVAYHAIRADFRTDFRTGFRDFRRDFCTGFLIDQDNSKPSSGFPRACFASEMPLASFCMSLCEPPAGFI